jgi:hypothetical protein
MKIRNGFVSNSSTSSFVCDVCGEEYTGWDAGPCADYDCTQCENEHAMCLSHLEDMGKVKIPDDKGCEHEFDREKNKFCAECGVEAWIEAEMENEDGYLRKELCPVCNFQTYARNEMAVYLEKTRKISRDEVFAEIKKVNKRRRKLYDEEYITHVCQKFELTDDILLKELKDKFGSFDEFAEFLRLK